MENYLWAALGAIVVVGLIRPLLWWVLLSLSLWIGRKICNDRWGKIVFGRYWYPRSRFSISAMLSGMDPLPSNPPSASETPGWPNNPRDR